MACLFQEGGITGIMFCHQTSGPVTGRAYKRVLRYGKNEDEVRLRLTVTVVIFKTY